jgi:hypothetical protein
MGNQIDDSFTVSDSTGPSLSILNEVSGDPTELGTDVEIQITVTDLSLIDSVWINFAGTDYAMNHLGSGVYNYSTTYPVGTYAYTIYANDTYGNQDSLAGPNIEVSDTIAPTLYNLVEVSGDTVEFNGTVYIRVNVTDLSTIDNVWINFNGTIYNMTYLSGDMYYYSESHVVGNISYSIYANDTYGNVRTNIGEIAVLDIVQTIIIFDLQDFATDSLTADTDFNVTLPIDNNSAMQWAKVYFKIASGPLAAAPGDDWTPIDLINGQTTISSAYYDAGEILSYYFEILGKDGNIFYVSSLGISTNNATAQTGAFSFELTEVTGVTPPFDLQKWLPYILGGVGVMAVVFVSVGIKKSTSKKKSSKKSFSKKDLRDMKEAGDAANSLLDRQRAMQKEASYAEKDKDYYTVVVLYEKLIVIADALFKFGRPGAADSIKNYKAKIKKYQAKAQEDPKTDVKQQVRQKSVEYLKNADEAEKTGDFGQSLVIHHQILLLREEINDKSQISATKANIKRIIAKIPNIKEISAGIVKEAEEKYKEKDYQTAYTNYRYLKTIFEALGDKTLIDTVDKLISDVSKYLKS